MTPTPPVPALSPEDAQILAEALLLWRYVGHTLFDGTPDTNSEARAHVALKLARRLGLFDGYWAVMQRTDVLSIAVRNLDDPAVKGPRKVKQPRRRAKYG